MMQRHSVDGFVFHPPRSVELIAATTVNHAARRGHILTQYIVRLVLLVVCTVVYPPNKRLKHPIYATRPRRRRVSMVI